MSILAPHRCYIRTIRSNNKPPPIPRRRHFLPDHHEFRPQNTRVPPPTGADQPQTKSCTSPSTNTFEKIFIQALVRVGHCTKHAQSPQSSSSSFTSPTFIPKRGFSTSSCRNISTKHKEDEAIQDTEEEPGQVAGYKISKDDLKNLVDVYSLTSEEEHNVGLAGLDHASPTDDKQDTANFSQADIGLAIHTLETLLRDKTPPHDEIWDVYRSLPYPAVYRLSARTLNNLLHHLSVVPLKTETSMIRYLSLVEELRSTDLKLKSSVWTSAIAFTGRCFKAISSTQVDAALHLWRQMEHEAGVQSTSVTFNVLFDLATKAGRYILAEMIMKEMERRNLEFNRHFRTGIIYHYGLRGDGNGVRKAYRDFVDAGEIVDTVVITCVIKSLLKCGEAVAAEQVFERAKRLHSQQLAQYEAAMAVQPPFGPDNPSDPENHQPYPDAFTELNHHPQDPYTNTDSAPYSTSTTTDPPPTPPTHWRAARLLGMALNTAARNHRSNPTSSPSQAPLIQEIQDNVSLAPNQRTYHALIYFHAVTAGDIDRATELAREMTEVGFHVDGAVYLVFMKGFSMHGGVAYTGWTRRRLESTWREFCEAVEAGGMGWVKRRGEVENEAESDERPLERLRFEPPAEKAVVYMSLVAAEYVVRAFARVAGYERTTQVWGEIMERAEMDGGVGEVAVGHIEGVLVRLFPDEYGAGPLELYEEDGQGHDFNGNEDEERGSEDELLEEGAIPPDFLEDHGVEDETPELAHNTPELVDDTPELGQTRDELRGNDMIKKLDQAAPEDDTWRG